ncbi:dihydrofolate reductase family protein [Cellulomonas cellasea]|uniref:Bacterial bifunctional deaminase-reductase C-terminal domain-containing protein n=2 Tax=Cellulomonas cellasea TaxID=43670 RepID=A0A0A0BAS6_9CELL|nr:dihydrofolate reductase family protein [Cellulomonas cellasea]KGM03283.1 hypothetical protein Q760_07245 [Cellulomonas cellasea DSM 20118]GEA87428.1 pyrimidine reductase [Cellulomonas cellasea]
MRTTVATVYASLDGVVDHPEKWSLPYFNEQAAAYQTDLLSRSDVLLQGRRTYEGFAPYWSTPSDDAYNDRMYEIPKVLISRTLTEGTWHNTTTVTDDPVAAVEKLRVDGDGHVLTYGFGSIAYALAEAGLLDEVHVWVHPVLARTAGPEDLMFSPGDQLVRFAHAGATTLDTGVTILRLVAEPRA